MIHVLTRLQRILATRRTQAVIFAGLVAVTALCIVLRRSHALPPKAISVSETTVHAELSQTKLIQG